MLTPISRAIGELEPRMSALPDFLESTERFPGAPRSPALDRTRAKVRELWELPTAAPVVLNVTHRDPYLEAALCELMCLAFAAGANDALRQVRK